MKKNNLNLALANILILTLMFSVSSTSFAQNNVYKWRLAETWPKDFPVFGDTARNFMQLVKEMSGGRLLIEEHTSEKHKKPLNILEMVRDGEYEMGHTATHYAKSLDLKTILFTAIPFGMIASEKEAWFDYGGGNELMKKVYDQYGINAYLGGNTGTQMGGWFKKEINSEADLVGLKIRIPGLAGNVMETLGVNVTNLPPSELYDALESGKIDAVEWVGPSMDIGMGFHKIAPFYYTGWHEPGSTLVFYVNKKAYDRLPKDLKSILTTAIRMSNSDMYTDLTHRSTVNLSEMRQKYPNIKIRAFPTRILRKLSRETDRQVDEMVKDDALAKGIVESMRSYQEKSRLWTRISDQAFINNAGL